ncbi:hypothetical protein HMPREF1981_03476 [Bacteroides pyogenes F0041]|uniref:Uncharacterized protein n=1 Tax=Bacteroides pyogenes F0041 TaxID=1321819 RepID=U2DMR7_9BACE|nr:hypothetical protein HMPREF1981_03476 [Bacteroides pyogenes F0041]
MLLISVKYDSLFLLVLNLGGKEYVPNVKGCARHNVAHPCLFMAYAKIIVHIT